MPFINVDKKKRKKILNDRVDSYNYLGLKSDRGRLINLAISLGIDRPLKVENKESLYRDEYVKNNSEMIVIITAAAIYGMKSSDEINDVLLEKNLFTNADECFNRGLDILAKEIDELSAQNYRMQLISNLDDLYEHNVTEHIK